MKRSTERMQWVVVILICLGSFSTIWAKKNVLFLIADDLNDWVGAFEGHPQARTPNIDRLAQKGVVFRNAHCAGPLCNPSRTAFMTGLWPFTTGITENAPNPDLRTLNYPDGTSMKNHVTLPQAFMNVGYNAAGGGKIYHRGNDYSGDTLSFNIRWMGDYGGIGTGKGPNLGILNTNFEWGASDKPVEDAADVKMSQWAGKMIDSLTKLRKPWYISIGVYRPHTPWFVPKEFWDSRTPTRTTQLPKMLANDNNDIPGEASVSDDEWLLMRDYVNRTGDSSKMYDAVSAYLACVNFMDSNIGIVLDSLEKSGLADSTIVVFLGDNGYHLGEKQHYGKTTLYDNSTRVPLIIYDPAYKGQGGGREVWTPVSLIDLYPTLLDLAELPPNAMNEGRSIAQFVRNATGSYSPWAFVAIKGKAGLDYALITNSYKLIRYSTGTKELYNLKVDPNEYKNLAWNAPANAPVQDTIKWLSEDIDRILKRQAPVNIGKFGAMTGVSRFRRDFSGKSGMSYPYVSKTYNLLGVEQKGIQRKTPGSYINSGKKILFK